MHSFYDAKYVYIVLWDKIVNFSVLDKQTHLICLVKQHFSTVKPDFLRYSMPLILLLIRKTLSRQCSTFYYLPEKFHKLEQKSFSARI